MLLIGWGVSCVLGSINFQGLFIDHSFVLFRVLPTVEPDVCDCVTPAARMWLCQVTTATPGSPCATPCSSTKYSPTLTTTVFPSTLAHFAKYIKEWSGYANITQARWETSHHFNIFKQTFTKFCIVWLNGAKKLRSWASSTLTCPLKVLQGCFLIN